MGILKFSIVLGILWSVEFLGIPLAFADTNAGLVAFDRADFKTAIKLLRPEAERGDAEAQVKYGIILAQGLGVARDPEQAIQWFQKSAAQGNAEAQFCMGFAHDSGDVGIRDLKIAAEWYRKSAEGGYAKAQFNLGKMLLDGDGIEQDVSEAAIWIRRAAEQEFGDAEITLATMHVRGTGVEVTMLGARYWTRRAALHSGYNAAKLLDFIENEFRKFEETGVPKTDGGDGSSIDMAISFPAVTNGMQGVDAEHRVTSYFFPGWRWDMQVLRSGPTGIYDVITLTKNGVSREIYFDITNWFGRMDYTSRPNY